MQNQWIPMELDSECRFTRMVNLRKFFAKAVAWFYAIDQ